MTEEEKKASQEEKKASVELKPTSQAPKQYLAVFDEVGMACLGRLMPQTTFIEISGMPLVDNPEYHVLVNKLPKPKEEPRPIPKEVPTLDSLLENA